MELNAARRSVVEKAVAEHVIGNPLDPGLVLGLNVIPQALGAAASTRGIVPPWRWHDAARSLGVDFGGGDSPRHDPVPRRRRAEASQPTGSSPHATPTPTSTQTWQSTTRRSSTGRNAPVRFPWRRPHHPPRAPHGHVHARRSRKMVWRPLRPATDQQRRARLAPHPRTGRSASRTGHPADRRPRARQADAAFSGWMPARPGSSTGTRW